MAELNIKNRSIFCNDNLNILTEVNSESVDLIYLDPPFNKKKVFTAPIGSASEGASFSDIFREEDVKEDWLETIREDNAELNTFLESVKNIEGRTSYNFCYLAYMAIRLIELRRILKDTGSLYLHCDPTMSHYLKILLDIIFGEKNFRNEIVWKRQSSHNDGKYKGKIHDVIFFYTNTKSNTLEEDIFYEKQYEEYDDEYIKNSYRHEEEDGRKYIADNITAYGLQGGGYEYEWRGHQKLYRVSKKRMEELDKQNKIHYSSTGAPYMKRYLDEAKGLPLQDLWGNISPALGNEKTGYPTQKPLALLERIIKASCPEDGVVLDPFCGCATTCVASEKLNRQWVGIDVSHKAYDLVKQRLDKEITGDLFDWNKDITYSVSPPKRTDLGEDIREKKWVYIISHEKYKGEYKVGIAKDWKSRLNSYQTSDPDRAYKMEYKILTPHFRAMEKYIHETFENKHEWVRAELQDIIKEMENYSSSPSL